MLFSNSIKLRAFSLSADTVSLQYMPRCLRSTVTCAKNLLPLFEPGLPGSHKQKRPDQPSKKPNSTEKSQIQDKYTTTPTKHQNALSKGNIHIFYT